MFCEICGEWAIGNTMCIHCEPVFNDMDKFPFSTATIQIRFTSNYFKTENPPDIRVKIKKNPLLNQKTKRVLIDKAQKARKQELAKLFSTMEHYGKRKNYTMQFKTDATRATSSLLQKRNRQLKLKNKEIIKSESKSESNNSANIGESSTTAIIKTKGDKDSFYNSCMIKKTYSAEMTGGVGFKTSCGLFFNSARITLGMWTHRKQVASEYIRLIRSVLGPHRFKITSMKTIFVNVAFKFSPCCLQPLPPFTTPLPPEFDLVDKKECLVVFNLSQVYEVVQDAYEKTKERHTLNYNPLITNQNKIRISVVGRGGGSLSLYRTGTVMQLGFSKLQTIVEEFQFLASLLEEKFKYPVQNQLDIYKRKKLLKGGIIYLPQNHPKFLM